MPPGARPTPARRVEALQGAGLDDPLAAAQAKGSPRARAQLFQDAAERTGRAKEQLEATLRKEREAAEAEIEKLDEQVTFGEGMLKRARELGGRAVDMVDEGGLGVRTLSSADEKRRASE